MAPKKLCMCEAPGRFGKTIGSSGSRWVYGHSARNSATRTIGPLAVPPYTWNSNSEAPHWVARWVIRIRTYRPLPLTTRLCSPPAPFVVVWIVVQLVALVEVWIWKPLAYAASQRSSTRLTACAEPRSTWSHWLSANELAQRVPLLPSTAAAAGNEALSTDEARAGRPCESRVSAACAGRLVLTR